RARTGVKCVERDARKLARWVRVPVVKRGRGGCIVVQDERALRMKAIRVHVVDAAGAGDGFRGGFLHGYLSGWSLEDSLRAANICGAIATTRTGGPSGVVTRGKLLELMKRI